MPVKRKQATGRKKKAGKKKAKRKSKETVDDIQLLLDRIEPEFLEVSARQMTRADVLTLVQHRDKVLGQFRSGSVLERFQADALVLMELVEDHAKGHYRSLPLWALSLITFSMLYVLRPIDVIPDTLPVIGQLDDALVVALCLSMTKKDVYDYTVWRLDTGPARRHRERVASKAKRKRG